MKIAFIVNDIATEIHTYTTINLAFQAMQMGHEAYIAGVGDLMYLSNGHMGANAFRVEEGVKSTEVMLGEMQTAYENSSVSLIESDMKPVKVTSENLDVMFIRNDPSDDRENRPWAQSAGVIFGKIAVRNGVIVLNDPEALHNALNKMYFQHFPELVRPRTIITRDVDDVRRFYDECEQKIVLKPLQGSGGKDVFMVKGKEAANLDQIVEAISRDGFVIVQEYLPAAKDGDTRMFVVNGHPLENDGKIACFQRVNEGDDFRSNLHAGGRPQKAEVTDDMLKLAAALRPKIIQDGLFMIGLDIVGDKLMEINVFSPGGMMSAGMQQGTEFFPTVIETIEKKVYYRKIYNGRLNNATLAIMD
ncbi:MAG: glutathione synthetase [Tunicatimonas sp.]|uniref:glutathione synthetase n=1 Tax=Tunicatimonas sp. TaxID=1940096 RepID=UPI003C758ACC